MPITITPGVVISPGIVFSSALPTATAVGYLVVAGGGGGGSGLGGGGGAGGFRSSSGYAATTGPAGSTYYVTNVGQGVALTGDFTIEYWYSGSSGVILCLGNENTYRAQMGVGFVEVFGSAYGTSWTWTAGTNVWNHTAIVRSGTTVTIYENGVLQTTKTANGPIWQQRQTVCWYKIRWWYQYIQWQKFRH